MLTRLLGVRSRTARRGLLVFAAFLAADVGVVLAACSTSSPDAVDGTDATSESAPPVNDAGKDSPISMMDSGPMGDAGGHCSAVTGGCDIVLQDCPPQQECVVDNSGVTICQPVQGTQQLPRGRACCPSTTANPCLPGLSCVGSDCVDGSAPTARCSPACCKGDDQSCGSSDPEGISGSCDLTLVDPTSQKELYQVCTYRKKCEPYQIEPCKTGETCLVEDMAGTASCVTSAGKGNRQPCSFGNECADGLLCVGAADASVCHYACLLPGSASPFDASVQNGGPGFGGCPANEKCNIQIQDLPAWYAVCSLDGG
jgi:hypothetical protein